MNFVKELAQATVVALVMFGPFFYYMLFSMKP
jgi:hypothetical protein